MDTIVRKRLINAMFIIVWVCLATDLLFFATYLIMGTLARSLPAHIVFKICLPFGVNFASYFVAKKYNASEEHDNTGKNLVCALALETIAGSMAVFHGYYVQLWVVPSIIILFCCVFHDEVLQRSMLVYDYALIVVAAAVVCVEHPENVRFYIESAVVVIVLATLVSLIASVMNKYIREMAGLTRNFHEKQEDHMEKMETDFLTGLYSKDYVELKAENALKYCNEDSPCSIAMIDLDDLKSINDAYGHEEGDKALMTLGKVVAGYMNEGIFAGRFGGEEFVIVFEGGEFDSHVMVLEDIRETFGKHIYDFTDRRITLSGGVKCCRKPVSYDDAVNEAEDALHRSKTEGKNRITVAPDG